MKKFLIFLFLIIAITIGEALGQESVSLAWDQDTDGSSLFTVDNLVGCFGAV
jgi:hypothetical protein